VSALYSRRLSGRLMVGLARSNLADLMEWTGQMSGLLSPVMFSLADILSPRLYACPCVLCASSTSLYAQAVTDTLFFFLHGELTLLHTYYHLQPTDKKTLGFLTERR